MATYKVLQDIEAEDKLIGPLTPRQCIYAAIAIVAAYLSFLCIQKGAPFLVAFLLPFMIFGGFFAWPWSKQQSTEVWALAKIRFALKPRKRIWDQSGMKDLVTITAPKTVEQPRASNLSETEVRSRLRALADTIDSRGWAIKNVPLGMYTQPYGYQNQSTDRLVDVSALPQEVPTIDTGSTTDMLDLAANPLAQQFENKMTAASTARHQQLMQQIDNPAPVQATAPAVPQNYWYMQQPATAPVNATAATPAYTPPLPAQATDGVPHAAAPTPEELALAEEIKHRQELLNSAADNSRYHKVLPISEQQAMQQAQATQTATPVNPPAQNQDTTVTPEPNPAILELANNNDLNVATLAREAQRSTDTPDEIVVSLHGH
jgi:hypothetical protein